MQASNPTTPAALAPPDALARPPRALPALLALAGVVCYANSLRGPFLFDDLSFALVGSNSLRNRPLVRATIALNRRLSLSETFGYHLFNLAIHVAVALLLFGIVRRTLARLPRAAGVAADRF